MSATRAWGSAGRHSGFTLMELLVVVAIIGILLGLLFPIIAAARQAIRERAARNQLNLLVMAIEKYKDEFGRYPLDNAPSNDPDEAIRGSKNLYHYLCQALRPYKMVGGELVAAARTVGPFVDPPAGRLVVLGTDEGRGIVSPLRTDPESGSYVYRRMIEPDPTAMPPRPEFFILIDVGRDGKLGEGFTSSTAEDYPGYSIFERKDEAAGDNIMSSGK
jgi:prepilin-type N-terminal cleavage/methylation domain-containing protein